MTIKGRVVLVLTVVLLGIALDQGTKDLARRTLVESERHSYLMDTFRLQLVPNDGAFLGLGSKLDKSTRFWVFTVLVGVTMVVLAAYVFLSTGPTRGQRIAFALILSCGTSNLADRIYNDGSVVDFLNLGIGPVRTGIFNVADMAILGGCLFLVFFGGKPKQAEQPSEEPAPAEE